jgi:hypothetical protein
MDEVDAALEELRERLAARLEGTDDIRVRLV